MMETNNYNTRYNAGSTFATQERENLYLGLIGECLKRVDGIRQKVTIITNPSLEKEGADTPNRTELEAELKRLLKKIQELENDIIV